MHVFFMRMELSLNRHSPHARQGRGGRGGKKGGGPNSKGGQTAPGAGAVGNGAPVGSAKGSKVVTVSDILSDRLTKLSTQHWPNKVSNWLANWIPPLPYINNMWCFIVLLHRRLRL